MGNLSSSPSVNDTQNEPLLNKEYLNFHTNENVTNIIHEIVCIKQNINKINDNFTDNFAKLEQMMLKLEKQTNNKFQELEHGNPKQLHL